MTVAQYPGTDNQKNTSYSEKHHFGYRWYDQNQVSPAFEFGFGLSYTSFKYSDIKVYDMNVTFTVENTGDV